MWPCFSGLLLLVSLDPCLPTLTVLAGKRPQPLANANTATLWYRPREHGCEHKQPNPKLTHSHTHRHAPYHSHILLYTHIHTHAYIHTHTSTHTHTLPPICGPCPQYIVPNPQTSSWAGQKPDTWLACRRGDSLLFPHDR